MSKAAGWLVHLFTASGAAFALLALFAAIDRQFAAMFWLLGAALFIDGIDGTLARRLRVAETAPEIDGGLLDLIVDYLTYVFVPVVAMLRADLMPRVWAMALGLAIVVGSALYFADRRMKTPDHWFRGFPTLWNVVAFYLVAFRPSAALCAAVMVGGVAAMFLPFAFVHPVRVRQWRGLTLAMLTVWIASALAMLWDGLDGGAVARAALLVSGAYFVALSALRRGPKT